MRTAIRRGRLHASRSSTAGSSRRRGGGSGSGTIFVNAKWQLNVNGLYQAPHGIEISANAVRASGIPVSTVPTGVARRRPESSDAGHTADRLLRFPNLWDTDVRAAKELKVNSVSLRLIFDLFNVFNASTALVRNDNIAPPTFDALAQTESANRPSRADRGILRVS